MSALWAWGASMMDLVVFVLGLLCHPSPHESLRIWNGPSLLIPCQSCSAMLLYLEWWIERLVSIEILMGVGVGRDSWILKHVYLSVRHATHCRDCLIRSISQIILARILTSRSHSSACRLRIFLSLIDSWACVRRREIRIHLSSASIIHVKLNILVGRTQRSRIMVRDKIIGTCR